MQISKDSGIDTSAVVAAVTHQVTAMPGRPGALSAEDDRYRAVFDSSGFSVDDLRVSLSDVRRGALQLPLESAAWRGEANVASRSVRPGITERVTARDGEVEWDVLLDRRPVGTGDLVVRAHVGGSTQTVTRTTDGLTFGPSGMRMSALVVKDATGLPLYRAVPELVGAELTLSVPSRVIDGATYPLTIDPTISPEHAVSDAVKTNAIGRQNTVHVAFDGTNYMVIWSDDGSGQRAIRGTRVSPAGVVLDPSGISITTSPDPLSADGIAFDGTNYLVVWERLLDVDETDIYGARVSTSGAVVGAAAFPISTSAGYQFAGSLAFDGTNYMVVWTDGRADTFDIYGARINTSGTVLDPSGIPISTATDFQSSPAVAFDGKNYLVGWSDERGSDPDIYGARVEQIRGRPRPRRHPRVHRCRLTGRSLGRLRRSELPHRLDHHAVRRRRLRHRRRPCGQVGSPPRPKRYPGRDRRLIPIISDSLL